MHPGTQTTRQYSNEISLTHWPSSLSTLYQTLHPSPPTIYHRLYTLYPPDAPGAILAYTAPGAILLRVLYCSGCYCSGCYAVPGTILLWTVYCSGCYTAPGGILPRALLLRVLCCYGCYTAPDAILLRVLCCSERDTAPGAILLWEVY
jgi:hypothetical protein